MKKLNTRMITALGGLAPGIVSTANAAKMCLGTPVVLAASIGITCGILLTSISVTCAASSVSVGGTISCSANVQPNNASDKGVTWSSNPPGVATVNSSGVVTGVTAGNVTITATAVDGSNVYGTTSVTVSNANSAANVASLCSSSSSNHFPIKNCGNASGDNSASTWQANSCPISSGDVTLYGKSRCSLQNDPGWGWSASPVQFHSVNYEPTDNKGQSGANYCWCQLCSDSTRTSCGAWVLYYDFGSASECSSNCAYFNSGPYIISCGSSVRGFSAGDSTTRSTLCAAP